RQQALEQAARKNGWGPEDGEAYLPLIDGAADPPDSCLAGSYFTQSRLVVDPTCPPGTILNVTALGPLDRGAQWKETPEPLAGTALPPGEEEAADPLEGKRWRCERSVPVPEAGEGGEAPSWLGGPQQEVHRVRVEGERVEALLHGHSFSQWSEGKYRGSKWYG